MSGEFYGFPSVVPALDDELLLVREQSPRRSTVAQLLAGIPGIAGPEGPQGLPGVDGAIGPQGPPGPTTLHIGPTSPTDPSKVLWAQLSGTGEMVEQWMRGPAGSWISTQGWPISSFSGAVNGNVLISNPNPCPGGQFFVDRFSVRAVLVDVMAASNLTDFKLNLVSQSQIESDFFFLRLQGPQPINSLVQLSEPVRQILSSSNALGLLFRTVRTGSHKFKYLSMSALLRRVYAP